jgi:hypothetical protein
MRNITICTLLSCAILFGSAAAQTRDRTAIPRLTDGKPDLNGIWQAVAGADVNLEDHIADRHAPGGQRVVEEAEIPYLPEALKQRRANYEKRSALDPETAQCDLPGVPRITYARNLPFQILQKPDGDKITILYEFAEAHRFLYTNGTTHPPGHINWWLGDSRAKWDADTLVVDSVDFNGDTWFDHAGDYHSEDLHVVERYTLIDADHLDYRVEIDDAKVYARPWHINLVLYRRKEKNLQLLDYVCYAFDLEKYYP